MSLAGSVVVIGGVAAVSDRLGVGRAKAGQVPAWAWLAGACGALVLVCQPIAAPVLGAATYIGLFVSASVVASILLDHFGGLGFAQHAAGIWRVVGAGLMIVGVTLVARS